MAALETDEHTQWIFLSSMSSNSSTVAVNTWENRPLASSPCDISLETPRFQVLPTHKLSLSSTQDVLMGQGDGLDWSFQNRLRQNTTGFACDIYQDIVRIWTCTEPGDVFVQQMNLKPENPNTVKFKRFTSPSSWVPQWTRAIRESERKSPLLLATEIYDAYELSTSEYDFVMNFTKLTVLMMKC